MKNLMLLSSKNKLFPFGIKKAVLMKKQLVYTCYKYILSEPKVLALCMCIEMCSIIGILRLFLMVI